MYPKVAANKMRKLNDHIPPTKGMIFSTFPKAWLQRMTPTDATVRNVAGIAVARSNPATWRM